MKRKMLFSLALAVSLAGQAQAANWFSDFFSDCKRTTDRNRAWPEPFQSVDRASATVPFNQMVANGWQRNNLLGDPHFEDDGFTLNQAGNLLIQRICNEPVPEHRALFVAKAQTAAINANRMASVQRQATVYLEGETPVVVASRMQVEGMSADNAVRINASSIKNQPEVKLPAASAGGGDASAAK